ncbi:MAG: aminomethyl transferase family protein, partial [Solimonas sp.]
TPYDMGYGGFVKFDHEFVGSAALQKIAKKPKKQKVTLVWDGDDVDKVFTTLFHAGKFRKYIDLPLANYSTLPFDRIEKGGKLVGVSTYTGYSFNERSMLSLACVDIKHAKPGTKVNVIWGEEDGGSTKPTVERHKQVKIRATVQPAPYGETARTAYRPK